MSHKATVWAIQQRGLKPATKIVLWFLCDRHNPDFGCFPTQERLADDAEMSISALNAHLAKLEELRLIHRVRVHDPRTHKRQATRYILGFEDGFPQEPTPKTGDGISRTEEEQDADPTPDSGHGAISGFSANPSPDFAQSHLRNPETNLVREPLSKPVKEEEDALAREAEFDRFFADLLTALGFAANATLPAWWQGWPAKTHVRRWIDDLGLSQQRIVEVATETRGDHPNPPDGPKALDRFMERAAQRDAQSAIATAKSQKAKRRRKREDPPRLSDDEKAAFYAKMVNADGFLPVSAINNSIRDLMLVRGLVTPERLRLRGVR
ncbi:helix-turn-helix domain-containing protein [Rhodobacter capsulatus]|uniref:Helix-turn-helix domain-containing protein n=1 Tax=Rhodobacter capsulatus TaxID=1061 RepID=A0A1G7SP75_RHOCA|nr:helix-turn-helix domain-containing protein [Rhodobacter capsulatus]WER10423.1 helix-turn-helix domain-containing protein [Rhodobacter capsulatus]SDG24239.1 Helix-turn-helix domain-containing protein [Rhodobacter capsulatus]